MTHSILDVTGFDKAGYGYLDRIYAGDLGGHVFAARYSKCTNVDCDNDSWQPKVLFNLASSGLGKKIMTRPEVALESGKECVYFGTGDRENPNGTSAVNAIYSVCNSWAVSQPEPLTIGNLVDVTDNLIQQGDDTQKAAVRTALDTGYGWYIRLTNAGEKLTSSPKLLNKKLYFTTFTPGALANNDDPCTVSYDYGVSRLYAVDYLTGAAVYNFNGDDQWTRADRSKIIGTSIAGEPVLTTNGDTTSLYYGSGGKFEGMPVETSSLVRRYFWRQLK
jgi:type IV pilus assembly protein PilY1